MPNPERRKKRPLHILAALLGTGLLVYLVVRAGSDALVENARTIGWGILLVLGLAGISHVVKTWAWRLTLAGDFKKVSFSRALGLRLVSEAIGQFGFVGQVVGDATRASLLTSELPASGIISSVALDRGLFMVSGLVVTIFGLITLLLRPAVSHGLKLYSGIFAIVLLALLGLSVWAVQRGWPLLSKSARAAGRVPWLGSWLQSKESVILSAEQQLLQFHRQAPAAFWLSTVLNFVTHGLAIAEVYLILLLMGSRVTIIGALMLEALTKLINAAGTVNPGNVGTYEGGNMAIVKLVGLHGTEGLTLGLCRRFRSIFWAVIGGICLLYYSRSRQNSRPTNSPGNESESTVMQTQEKTQEYSDSFLKVAIVLANPSSPDLSNSVLAEIGALPVVFRAILSARSAGADRIIVVVDPVNGAAIRRRLAMTKRLPNSVEWLEALPEHAIPAALRLAATYGGSVILIMGDHSYHPSLYRMVSEWKRGQGALELTSGGKPIGLTVLSQKMACDIATNGGAVIHNVHDLYAWILSCQAAGLDGTTLESKAVPDELWQSIETEEDRVAAEAKLDGWLVKPTDGIFARMNRRISIPISHQLIKFPITPNMVSLFTLGVSFASGLYFGFGGYWNALIGAVLSVWASILDGCDGEVARLKLQVSDFGCWIDTVCDYLYYVFIFVGMTVGLVRSTGKMSYLTWGGMLLFGAIATFVFASIGRKRLSGQRPEQYLAEWQKKAENRMSNPLAYVGRHLEFVVRRCFLPYALLAFALLNLTWIPVCVGAVGANLAWIVSAYSVVAFSPKQKKPCVLSATSASAASV
jgi:phosphatidylglycerophosphate synthase